MSKHTPGPWRAPLIGGNHGSTGIVWADEPHGPVATVCCTVANPDVAVAANARLIAAAPDMLAALKELAFRARLSPEDASVETAALAAIAKAEGRDH